MRVIVRGDMRALMQQQLDILPLFLNASYISWNCPVLNIIIVQTVNDERRAAVLL